MKKCANCGTRKNLILTDEEESEKIYLCRKCRKEDAKQLKKRINTAKNAFSSKSKMKNKDIIKSRKGFNVFINHKNIECRSLLFDCDEIEYMHDRGTFNGEPIFDHHLMFWNGKNLIFKVWLKQKKEYKNVNEALEDVGIKVVKCRY